ncbi:MAG: phosphatidate cytidylyltransferase [Pararhodobacter sp.]|nr:phosphatidate cytidylyltransferase [Pararhodobacter sp.]
MSDARFGDLGARLASAVVMIVLGAGALWAGGHVFAVLAIVLAGLMGWELARMMQPDAPPGMALALGAAASVLVGALSYLAGGWVAVAGLLAGAALLSLSQRGDRAVFAAYMAMILLAAHGLIVLRAEYGLIWVLWLILIVIGSDVAGYFAGRLIGGPKFWPRISPKKTWSGTVAGWVVAVCIGLGFVVATGAPAMLVAVSVLLALAGQLGDIAESAIKRRKGVKDSSNLIPGHGGVLDRFDALIAVAMLAHLLALAGLMPALPVAGAI